MTQFYGPTFARELVGAGVGGLPMSWSAEGTINFDDSVTQELRATVLAVAAAHDRLAMPPLDPDQVAAKAAMEDTQLAALAARTPAEAAAWIDANVNNLVEAKAVLRVMAKALCVLARRL